MFTFPGFFRLQSDREPPEFLQGVSTRLLSLLDPDQTVPAAMVQGAAPIVILQLTNEPLLRPFVIMSRRRAKLTTAYLEHAAGCTDPSQHLALVCLLALTQLRTLALNEVLEAEDMLYTCHPDCVFSAPDPVHEVLMPTAPKIVCGGCKEFYSSLGAAREIESIEECLGKHQGR